MWPVETSGVVGEAPSETWKAIDLALRQGLSGLEGGSSLGKVLKAAGS